MAVETAATLEHLVNAYISRALQSPEDLLEVATGFGLELEKLRGGSRGRRELAHAIATKVLGATWHYKVIDESTFGDPKVRIVITGRS
jgi:hypothetical protein